MITVTVPQHAIDDLDIIAPICLSVYPIYKQTRSIPGLEIGKIVSWASCVAVKFQNKNFLLTAGHSFEVGSRYFVCNTSQLKLHEITKVQKHPFLDLAVVPYDEKDWSFISWNLNDKPLTKNQTFFTAGFVASQNTNPLGYPRTKELNLDIKPRIQKIGLVPSMQELPQKMLDLLQPGNYILPYFNEHHKHTPYGLSGGAVVAIAEDNSVQLGGILTRYEWRGLGKKTGCVQFVPNHEIASYLQGYIKYMEAQDATTE